MVLIQRTSIKFTVAILATVVSYTIWFWGKKFYAVNLYDISNFTIWLALVSFIFYSYFFVKYIVSKKLNNCILLVIMVIIHLLIVYQNYLHYEVIKNRVYLKISNTSKENLYLIKIQTDTAYPIKQYLKNQESAVIWFYPSIKYTSPSSFDFNDTFVEYLIDKKYIKYQLPNLYYGECLHLTF